MFLLRSLLDIIIVMNHFLYCLFNLNGAFLFSRPLNYFFLYCLACKVCTCLVCWPDNLDKYSVKNTATKLNKFRNRLLFFFFVYQCCFPIFHYDLISCNRFFFRFPMLLLFCYLLVGLLLKQNNTILLHRNNTDDTCSAHI